MATTYARNCLTIWSSIWHWGSAWPCLISSITKPLHWETVSRIHQVIWVHFRQSTVLRKWEGIDYAALNCCRICRVPVRHKITTLCSAAISTWKAAVGKLWNSSRTRFWAEIAGMWFPYRVYSRMLALLHNWCSVWSSLLSPGLFPQTMESLCLSLCWLWSVVHH